MKENKTIKTIAIAVVSILIIAIIGLGIYTVFIKKDDNQGVNNNQNNNQENYVDTKVSYGTSDDVHLEYPSGIDNKNLTKNEVKPVKSITTTSEKEENIKIDENLTIILSYDEIEGKMFGGIIYKNKNLTSKEFNISRLDDEKTLDVYKLGQNYLVKTSVLAQTSLDNLLILNEKGELTYLFDSEENISNGILSKVEHIIDNSSSQQFYSLEISGVCDGECGNGTSHLPEDTILYIYKK